MMGGPKCPLSEDAPYYDCNDNNADVNPGAEEIAGDGIDNDCDGQELEDNDGDGHSGLEDCDDDDPEVYWDAPEVMDCKDNDCDGDVDEETDTADDDLDGFCEGHDFGQGAGVECCDGALPGDCDDDEPADNPLDFDGDGISTCDAPADCDDYDDTRFPGAVELCDQVDNDCDGMLSAEETDGDGDGWAECQGDCDDTDMGLNPEDFDGDGYTTCNNPPDCDDYDAALNNDDLDGDLYSTCTGDCDESDADVYPTAPELPNGNDDDCDGTVDEGTDTTDNDGDGWCVGADLYGNGPECTDGSLPGDCDDGDDALNLDDADGDGYSTCDLDCDDLEALTYPGAPEQCDSQDNDCDGTVDEGVGVDGDGDGYYPCNGDCDDTDMDVYPGAPDLCDWKDNNCDGLPEADEVDDDGDGWDECQGDCDDADPTLHPGGWEDPADGIDSDCDGTDANGLRFADITITGEFYSRIGMSAATAGDVDGDGLADVMVGATFGEAHLLLGSTLAGGGSFESVDADADFSGEFSGDLAGAPLAGAGDVDGDGLDDVLICAEGNDEGGNDAGKVYLMWGDTLQGGGSFSLANADVALLGEAAGDAAGTWASSAGDVDGDGLADLLVGAEGNNEGGNNAGKAYLMLAATIQGGGTFGLGTADAQFVGEQANCGSGTAVSSAGDVDGDGLDDILIGADGYSGRGRAYLMTGATVAAGGTFGLAGADATFTGDVGNYAGSAVSSAGDVDGDGFDDLLVGAWGSDDGGSDAGKTYLMFGSTVQGGGAFDLLAADGALVGEAEGDQSGFSVCSAGDVDGDGLGDIFVGAWLNSDGGTAAGKAYLMLGATIQNGGTYSLSSADVAFVGEDEGDYASWALSPAGDVDGDGFDDLLVGAWGNEDNGSMSGKAYILFSPY